MHIDESGKYAFTKFTNKRVDRVTVKDSDHRTIIVELSLKWSSSVENSKKSRVEIFDFKNKASFDRFVELTRNNNELENCFEDPNEDIEK